MPLKQPFCCLSVEEHCFHGVARKECVEIVETTIPNARIYTSLSAARLQDIPESNPFFFQYSQTGIIILVSTGATDAVHHVPEEVPWVGIIFFLPQRLSSWKRPENKNLSTHVRNWGETFYFHIFFRHYFSNGGAPA